MKKSNLISSLRGCPGSWTKRKPPPCALFTCPAACSFIGKEGETLWSPTQTTFPLLLEKAFPCLTRCPQLSASSGNCSLYLCLQPGSTVGENFNSHHLDTAGPRREVLLIAKSSLTTEASLPREHYHHPQPIVGKLRHKEIKNLLMLM